MVQKEVNKTIDSLSRQEIIIGLVVLASLWESQVLLATAHVHSLVRSECFALCSHFIITLHGLYFYHKLYCVKLRAWLLWLAAGCWHSSCLLCFTLADLHLPARFVVYYLFKAFSTQILNNAVCCVFHRTNGLSIKPVPCFHFHDTQHELAAV